MMKSQIDPRLYESVPLEQLFELVCCQFALVLKFASTLRKPELGVVNAAPSTSSNLTIMLQGFEHPVQLTGTDEFAGIVIEVNCWQMFAGTQPFGGILSKIIIVTFTGQVRLLYTCALH